MSETLSKKELDREFRKLNNSFTSQKVYLGLAIFLMLASVVIFMSQVNLPNLAGIQTNYVFIIGFVILFFGIFSALYSTRYAIKKVDKLFFYFCAVYIKINDFIEEPTYKSQSIATTKINDASLYVEKWTRLNTPSVISESPRSISKNFDKLWDFVDNIQIESYQKETKEDEKLKIQELKSFNNELKDFVNLTYNRQPTFDELLQFNHIFKKIKKPQRPPAPSEKIKDYVKSHPKMRLFLSPVTGVIVFIIFYTMDTTNFSDPLRDAIFAGLMSIVPLYLWYKNN